MKFIKWICGHIMVVLTGQRGQKLGDVNNNTQQTKSINVSTSAILASEDPSEPQALVCPRPVHSALIVYIQLHRCPGYKRKV